MILPPAASSPIVPLTSTFTVRPLPENFCANSSAIVFSNARSVLAHHTLSDTTPSTASFFISSLITESVSGFVMSMISPSSSSSSLPDAWLAVLAPEVVPPLFDGSFFPPPQPASAAVAIIAVRISATIFLDLLAIIMTLFLKKYKLFCTLRATGVKCRPESYAQQQKPNILRRYNNNSIQVK